MTRKIARSIARHNMKAMKMEKINKKRRTENGFKSIFSMNWRKFAHFMPKPVERSKKRSKGVSYNYTAV